MNQGHVKNNIRWVEVNFKHSKIIINFSQHTGESEMFLNPGYTLCSVLKMVSIRKINLLLWNVLPLQIGKKMMLINTTWKQSDAICISFVLNKVCFYYLPLSHETLIIISSLNFLLIFLQPSFNLRFWWSGRRVCVYMDTQSTLFSFASSSSPPKTVCFLKVSS